MTVDNTDGRFTLGSATYSIGLNQQVRVLVNGVAKWTGFVQSWPVSWPTGGQEYSVVQVTAVDAFSKLSKTTLRSALEEDVLKDNPTATYPLSEEAAATTAHDGSGNGMPALAIAGTGTPFVFGSGTGPLDGLTCASFLGGTFLRNSIPAVYLASGATAWSQELYFATTQVPGGTGAHMLIIDPGSAIAANSVFLALSTGGKLIGGGTAGGGTFSIVSAASVNDGLVHSAQMALSGGTVTLYLDGVSVGTSGGVAAMSEDLTRFSVAPSDLALTGSPTVPFVGTVAHAGIYPAALSAARAAVHADARNDHPLETPAARIARVAGYCGVPVGTLDTAGNTTLGLANQNGRNALDILNETADASLGFVMLNGNGQVINATGYTVVGDITADSILDAVYASTDTAVEADMAFVINEATGGNTTTENTYTARNAFSIGVHGLYHQDFTWNVSTDAQATDRTNWVVNVNAGPSTRFPSLTFDVLTMDAGPTAQAAALDISAFLHVTGLPSQVSGIADLIVQGITWTLSADSYDIEVNCTKHVNYAAWILGDAVWGVLGSTTKLYAA
jgi:hypothetical protein